MIRLIANGVSREVASAPDRPLVEPLRRNLGLTGTRFGCGQGRCGACTMILDWQAVRSHQIPAAAAADREIITIEGLGSPQRLHPLGAAVREAQGPHAAITWRRGGPPLRSTPVLLGLAGRRLVRDEISRYEAVAIGLVDPHAPNAGMLLEDFPAPTSPLRLDRFFDTLYETYDLRFPYVAASVIALRRSTWDANSPALTAIQNAGGSQSILGYDPRVA